MIERNLKKAVDERYDLIVIGGGVYGASLAMEAGRRGLRPLLLEREDFGGATSWNSQRILHGGLRYLQSLDLQRFRESVGERRWFCRHFPELVRPLKCLMPLHGDGLRKPSVFKVALLANDLLSHGRNRGVRADRQLPNGQVLSAAATAALFPRVDREGLRGGALWYDAVMTSSQRIVIELLHWACRCGAVALNYVECRELIVEGRRVGGVVAVDRVTDQTVEFRAPVVMNCAGPWSRQLARSFDRDEANLFRPSLAFTALLDRRPLTEAAVAVRPRYFGARTYFLLPWRNRIIAGTFHASWQGPTDDPQPSPEQLEAFISDLNRAIPDLDVTTAEVMRVYSGLLPARAEGTVDLAVREVILNHGVRGGPVGFWSISGIKFTTARLVAEKTLRRAFGSEGRDIRVRSGTDRPAVGCAVAHDDPQSLFRGADRSVAQSIRRLIQEEAVVYMEDLLLRRTDWGYEPQTEGALATRVTELIGWELPSRAAATGARVNLPTLP